MSKRKRNNKTKYLKFISSIICLVCILIYSFIMQNTENTNNVNENISQNQNVTFDLSSIPEYSSSPYVEINNNIPYFEEKDYTTKSFENYSELDVLGRCGVAFANVCTDIMPPAGDKRGDISSVKPSGWKQKKYNGEYLYNRCHLIGYQLSDEDANKQNLITGTRYLNVEGMLPFENKVADYIKSNKNNHVLYRVTPIFKENNLVASGVQMEAWSVEDNGQGVCFNIYCYNVQPGIIIDYTTGESQISAK